MLTCITNYRLSVSETMNNYAWPCIFMGFPSGTVVKNLPTSAADARNMGSIPGSGRSPGVEMATHSSILAWEIPWTGESGGLEFMGSQRVRHDWATEHAHTHTHTYTSLKAKF